MSNKTGKIMKEILKFIGVFFSFRKIISMKIKQLTVIF